MDMMMGKSTIGSVGSGVKEADTVYLLRIQLQDFILIKKWYQRPEGCRNH